jgi:hypothetical protein
MSILRYLNKHHGWYDGKCTPFSGAEEIAAAPLLLEAIAPEAAATVAPEVIGAGIADSALLGGEYLGGLGATGETLPGVYSGTQLGGEYAANEAAQEAARQAAIQNAGNSALANVPANQVGSYSGNELANLQTELNTLANNPSYSNMVADASKSAVVDSNAAGMDYNAGLAGTPSAPSPYAPTPTGGLTPAEMQAGSGIQGIGPNLAGTAGGNIPTPGLSQFMPSQNQLMVGGGLYALNSMMNADRNKYGVPATQHYEGPLSKLKYDPSTYNYTAPINRQYTPNYGGYARMGYAEGGITQLQNADKNFTAGGMYPGSQIDHTQYSSSPQTPMSMQSTLAGYDPETNPLTGEPTTHMAKGGIARLLKGRGDGMSDSIHATIADKQPARLADGEFVVPADVVSHLGNGSTDAGARHLYKMMDKVRHARTGSKKQGKQIAAGGYLPIK